MLAGTKVVGTRCYYNLVQQLALPVTNFCSSLDSPPSSARKDIIYYPRAIYKVHLAEFNLVESKPPNSQVRQQHQLQSPSHLAGVELRFAAHHLKASHLGKLLYYVPWTCSPTSPSPSSLASSWSPVPSWPCGRSHTMLRMVFEVSEEEYQAVEGSD